MQVITKLLFLQVLFGQVLKVTFAERSYGRNVDAGLFTGDLNSVTENTGLAVDLDSIVKKFLL